MRNRATDTAACLEVLRLDPACDKTFKENVISDDLCVSIVHDDAKVDLDSLDYSRLREQVSNAQVKCGGETLLFSIAICRLMT